MDKKEKKWWNKKIGQVLPILSSALKYPLQYMSNFHFIYFQCLNVNPVSENMKIWGRGQRNTLPVLIHGCISKTQLSINRNSCRNAKGIPYLKNHYKPSTSQIRSVIPYFENMAYCWYLTKADYWGGVGEFKTFQNLGEKNSDDPFSSPLNTLEIAKNSINVEQRCKYINIFALLCLSVSGELFIVSPDAYLKKKTFFLKQWYKFTWK